jgi:uncharacterized protein YkvS
MRKEMAKIGDEIVFKSLIRGIVEKVNQNSVIVNITKNYTDYYFMNNKTVVAHKNYILIEDLDKQTLL